MFLINLNRTFRLLIYLKIDLQTPGSIRGYNSDNLILRTNYKICKICISLWAPRARSLLVVKEFELQEMQISVPLISGCFYLGHFLIQPSHENCYDSIRATFNRPTQFSRVLIYNNNKKKSNQRWLWKDLWLDILYKRILIQQSSVACQVKP